MTAIDLPAPAKLKRAKAPFAQAVFVCGKCARKFPGGRKAVRKALKTALKSRRWGKVRLVETRCLDLCPKHRQVLASAMTLARRKLVVVEPGFEAVAALEELLGPTGDQGAAEQGLALPG
jgi:hypothetical protein